MSQNMNVPQNDFDLLAVGETVVDMISQEETTSLLHANIFRKNQGGSPANLATNMARLGKSAAIVSKIGAGPFGHFLKAELSRAGVNTDYLVMTPEFNSTVIFLSRTSGTAESQAFRGADYHLQPDEISEELIRRARIIYATAFALSREPSRSAVEKVLSLGQKYGKIVSLDPNFNPDICLNPAETKTVLQRMFSYTSISKPSLDDAQRLFGPGQTPEEYIARFHDMGPEVVVLTMGMRGTLVAHHGQIEHVPARPVPVVDATGAGDAFWAGFLTALLDGKPLRRCALFAREVAERKLARVGPLPEQIDPNEIYARLDEEGESVVGS